MSSYQAVLAAVREWVKAQDQQFDVWAPRWQLADSVPGSMTSRSMLSDLYASQVLRALSVLADEGTLVKHGTGRDAVYMTPEADRISKEKAEQARQERAAELETWRQRKMRLAGHHLLDISSSVTDIRLSPESWDGLLAALDELKERREASWALSRWPRD